MQQADLIDQPNADWQALCAQQPLERCPCCGGKAIHHCNQSQAFPDTYWFWVQCEACGLATRYVPSIAAKCIPLVGHAWNQRTPASKSAAKDTAQ